MVKGKLKSTKRFGARYGKRIRAKVEIVEEKLKNWQKCPYCTALRVKRKFKGVWECKKCENIFTGKAYEV